MLGKRPQLRRFSTFSLEKSDKKKLDEIQKTAQLSKKRKQESFGGNEKNMVIIPEYAKQSDLKKRGRKREKWEIYVQNAEEKIALYK